MCLQVYPEHDTTDTRWAGTAAVTQNDRLMYGVACMVVCRMILGEMDQGCQLRTGAWGAGGAVGAGRMDFYLAH